MRHLPADAKTKMGMNEPFAYGALIMAMDPKGGPKPRDVLNQFLRLGGPRRQADGGRVVLPGEEGRGRAR